MSEPHDPPGPNGTLPDPPCMLPAVLDMKAAVGLADQFKRQPLEDRPAMVDGSAVTRIGTPALQLLCVLATAADRAGRRFVLKDPSDALRRAMVRIGLEDKLSAWEGIK
ncbi:MAG: STAS domain-containing protein [Alphaproteobacteria bacterium]